MPSQHARFRTTELGEGKFSICPACVIHQGSSLKWQLVLQAGFIFIEQVIADEGGKQHEFSTYS